MMKDTDQRDSRHHPEMTHSFFRAQQRRLNLETGQGLVYARPMFAFDIPS